MRTKVFLFINCYLFILLTGCSHNITRIKDEESFSFFNRVNNILKDKSDCSIYTIEEKEIKAGEIIINPDTTKFYDNLLNKKNQIPTDVIKEISFEGTGTSLFEGILFGGLAGGAIGRLSANPDRPGLEKAYSTGVGIGVGILTGVIAGYLISPKTKIRLIE